MATNGQAIRYGQVTGLRFLDDVEPETKYVLREIEHAAELADGTFELVKNGRVIFQGNGRVVVGELAKIRAYTPIELVGLHLKDQRSVFKFLTDEEREAGLPRTVWRSKAVT